MAHRHSPRASNESPITRGGAPASRIGPLGPLGDRMEVGFPEDLGPRDSHMVDVATASLKHGQSPPKAPTLNTGGSSSSSVLGSSLEGSTDQVSLSTISVVGAQGGKDSFVTGRSRSSGELALDMVITTTVKGVRQEPGRDRGKTTMGEGISVERSTVGGSGISSSSDAGDLPSSPPSLATTIPAGGSMSPSPTSPLEPRCGGGKVVGGKESNPLI